MVKIFDTHAHLLSSRSDEDRVEFIEALPAQNVVGVVECATKDKNIDKVVELAESFSIIYAALGVYPHEARCYTDELEQRIERLYREHGKVVAIGEIGLDYYYDGCPRDIQRDVLHRQLALAERLDAPVSLHCRDAAGDMLEILGAHKVKGVMHCYSGSVETAKELLKMGLYFGIGGSLTFKNNVKGPQVVDMLPLEKILLETDAPYLAPIPKRGERNTPAYISYVAEKITQIKGISVEEVYSITCANACKLFGIKEV